MEENNEEYELYIHKDTLDCAYSNLCIPCFYKIFPFYKNKNIKNQRPEMCPRSKNKQLNKGLYDSNLTILTVGDGDFSFSKSLCEGLLLLSSSPSSSSNNDNNNNNRINMVASSYESYETVTSVYPNAQENITSLISNGITVLHNVDSTLLENVPVLQQYRNSFDIIVWNFPCKRAEGGADAQVNDIEDNKNLLRGFFLSSQQFLKINSNSNSNSLLDSSRLSEIHITHKTIEPFCWWNITNLAKEYNYYCDGAMIFDRYLYPGYVNRKALDKKSFPFNDARVSN